MSDTPRTDAERRKVKRGRYFPTDPVSAEFARQLERELKTTTSELLRKEKELRELKQKLA